jgi:hypothetical protein
MFKVQKFNGSMACPELREGSRSFDSLRTGLELLNLELLLFYFARTRGATYF